MTKTAFCSNHYYTNASFNPAIMIALSNKTHTSWTTQLHKNDYPLSLSLVTLSSCYDEAGNVAKGVKCSG